MDHSILYFLNSLPVKYPEFNLFFVFLASTFGIIVIFALAYFLLVHKDKKRGGQELILMVTVAVVAWLLAHVLKEIFQTERPFVNLPDVLNLFVEETGYAFPSGHATFYAALATMMWFYHKRIALVLALVAFLVGTSRVVVGIHWPIDVLGGYILGILISICAYFLMQKYWSRS